MSEEKYSDQIARLITDCEEGAVASLRSGRRHYFASYTLMVVSVASSVLAGILALKVEATKELVGAVALVPALCAGIASQLRLVPKGNWYYHRNRLLQAHARIMLAMNVDKPTRADLDSAIAGLNRIEADLEKEWDSRASFVFTAAGQGSGKAGD